MLPYVGVSHLVTRREIPFEVRGVEAPTRDNARALVDLLLTFSIAEPFLFVYKISADDFDQVLRASCQDVIRTLICAISAQDVLDLKRADAATLQQAIGQDIEPYGVAINRVMVTFARPPEAYMRSQEERQLAVIQRAEQTERQLLALQRQADAAALVAQQVASDAASEAQRLQQLEERVLRNPVAAQYDLERARLDVARALAGNNRTLLHIGGAGELTQPLQLDGLLPSGTRAFDDGRLHSDDQAP